MIINSGESWIRPQRTPDMRQELFNEPTASERSKVSTYASTAQILMDLVADMQSTPPQDGTADLPATISLPDTTTDVLAPGGLVQENGTDEGNTYVFCFSCGQNTPHWGSGSAGGCMYCNDALHSV